MRQIKFRAWDEENGMYPVEILHFNKEGIHAPYVKDVMQFTGLRDKNGKEIYEGDIVQAVYQECEGGGWISKHNVKGKVIFDTHWGVKFDCRDYTQRVAEHWGLVDSAREFRAVEIIGNVLENPELLK